MIKYILLFVMSSFYLSGCTTFSLWKIDNHEIIKTGNKVTTGKNLYTAQDSKTICISYEDANNINDKQMKYLAVTYDDLNNTDYLKAIFKDPLNLKVKSVSAEARHHKNINGNDANYLIFHASFNIPDESVRSVDVESKTFPDIHSMYKTLSDFKNHLLGIAIIKQYLNINGSIDKIKPNVWVSPLAWSNTEGKIIMPEDSHITGDKKLLVRINNDWSSNMTSRYVLLDFDIGKYKAFNENKSIQRIITDYPNNLVTYVYGAVGDDPMKLTVVRENCSDAKFTPLTHNNTPIRLTFTETKEQYKTATLLLQILGTPFTFAADVVTFPFQLLTIGKCC